MFRVSHRAVNNLISVVVIGFAIYIVAIPLLPTITYAYKSKRTDPSPYGSLGNSIDGGSSQAKPVPTDNRIVIPSALIDQPILSGSSLSVIDDGGSWMKTLWTNSPKDPGNTIILGHRFTYEQPEGAFYHLNRVVVGDMLAIYWEKEELLYVVTEVKTVPATEIAVEDNTADRKLTLYTCTPLFTAKDRLVIIAEPVVYVP